MRMLTKLLIQSSNSTQACELAKRAYVNKYQCPADMLIYDTALKLTSSLVEAERIYAEALEVNDQLRGTLDLYERSANIASPKFS